MQTTDIILQSFDDEPSIRKLIDDLVTNNVDIMGYMYAKQNVCCISCNMKIIAFYLSVKDKQNKQKYVAALYSILTSTFNDIHVNDLQFKEMQYDYKFFMLLYKRYFVFFVDYTQHLTYPECLIIMDKPLGLNVIMFLRQTAERIDDVTFNLVLDKMDMNRGAGEHVMFCKVLSFYIDEKVIRKESGYLGRLMNYLSARLHIREISEIYKRLMRLT